MWTERLTVQVGTGNPSVAEEVAEVQKVLQASGLKYTMHSAGTTVGKWPGVRLSWRPSWKPCEG